MKYELINYCEIDKYANKAYSLIHNEPESKNLGDITKINEKEISDFNTMVGGSPCQDFSVAGKQEGAKWTCKDCKDEEGNNYEYNPLEVHYSKRDKCPHCGSINIEKTRSSLVVEWLRILHEKKPNLAIYENVKNLVGNKHKYFFDLFIKELHEYGYNTYYKVLNSKYFGIPQNRERIYVVIIKKEIDNCLFKFPQEFNNGIRLKDILEDIVDEQFYLSQEITNKLIEQLNNKNINCKESKCILIGNTNPSGKGMNGCVYSEEGVSPTITTNKGEGNKILQLGLLDIKGKEQTRRVYDADGISPTLDTMKGGNRQPKILEKSIETITFTRNGNIKETEICNTITAQNPLRSLGNNNPITGILETNKVLTYNTKDENGKEPPQQDRVYNTEEIMNCGREYKDPLKYFHDYRIRKLTPLECFRLMGFNDEDYYILKENKISNSQLYKMAGNSIVVDVLYYILLEIQKVMPYLLEDIKLGSFFSGIGAFEKAILRL